MTLKESIAEKFSAVALSDASSRSPDNDAVGPRRLGFPASTPTSGESLSTYSLIGGFLAVWERTQQNKRRTKEMRMSLKT